MFCSIRCWKLSGVSILCRSLAEAQSFGLLIVSLLRSTTSAWPPNPVGDEGHAAIKFVCWSQGISFVLRPLLKASCWGKQPLHSEHILSKTTMVLGLSRPLMGHLFPGMCHSSTCFFIKQPEPVWRLPTQSPPSKAFAFLLLMNCFPCSGAFLSTYFSCLSELLLSFWLWVMHLCFECGIMWFL